MGLFNRNVEPHVWTKKDVDMSELKNALENNSEVYNNGIFKKIQKKYRKFEQRGVSNLYLIKEVEDEGVVCATYAFSISDDHIDEEVLQTIREAAAQYLSVGEMRETSFDQKPDEWWERNIERLIKNVEKGGNYGFIDVLTRDLVSKGIVITERQVRKRKYAEELECSAVAWGIKGNGLRKGVFSYCISNKAL